MSLLRRGPSVLLALEDGSVHRGHGFGEFRAAVGGEVVFHTGMSGYPEIITDPSYRGQIVVLTYPHAGNYAMPAGDYESGRIQVAGLVVHRLCRHPSGVSKGQRLEECLAEAGVPALEGVDTRAITKALRKRGALRGRLEALPEMLRDHTDLPEDYLSGLRQRVAAVPSMEGAELASAVTTPAPEFHAATGGTKTFHVALLHMGAKSSIVKQLTDRGCRVTALPASSSATDILATGASGLLISNGPGDPSACVGAVVTVRELLGHLPIFGICLGHQILALAAGARTYKLPFGHHGANHPVSDRRTGRVAISSQNHGFSVDEQSLAGTGFELSHRSLYDGTVEGIESTEHRAFGIQYHPEGAPGPHDARDIFDHFVAHLAEAR